jgi:ribonucleoside-diphosphate reductase alpha chain
MDYIFRWLGSKFLNRQPEVPTTLTPEPAEVSAHTVQTKVKPDGAPPISSFTEHEKETFQNQADAPICTECGSLMVRNGACFKCLNCGSVFGCS